MKKKILLPILGILFVLSFVLPGYGGRAGIGVTAGYALPGNTNLDGALTYGINFCYEITKYFALEVSGLRFQSGVTGEVDSLSDGTLTVMPLQLSLQGRYPVNNQLVPYVSGGIGYYLNSFALDNEVVNNWNAVNFDIEESLEHAIGFHFGAGIDYFIIPNIAVNADFKYCIFKAAGTWTLTDLTGTATASGDIAEIDLNTVIFTAGVKYFF
ncbi:MAG: porin family protein [Candidatus Aminicenantes bacterium]|nr:porin family protein [Candidatus Aminicenantes bacterium]